LDAKRATAVGVVFARGDFGASVRLGEEWFFFIASRYPHTPNNPSRMEISAARTTWNKPPLGDGLDVGDFDGIAVLLQISV
jgi:hypothetical protein